jgi:hypothetical protein
MSNGMTFAGVPTREDCASCSEAGGHCTLHQGTLHVQQESGGMVQRQQAHEYDPAGYDDQPVSEKSHMAKKAVREMNRAKTQEGQMISVSSSSSSSLPSSPRYLVGLMLTFYRL